MKVPALYLCPNCLQSKEFETVISIHGTKRVYCYRCGMSFDDEDKLIEVHGPHNVQRWLAGTCLVAGACIFVLLLRGFGVI